MQLDAGDTVGSYEIETELGGGGFGQTFRALHTGTHERVVLKFPHAASFDEAAAEAQAIGGLGGTHDAIVTVRDVVVNDNPFVVLEYVDGIGLDDYLSERDTRLEPSLWWRTLRPLLSGVQHLHSAEIVHRDIKPANVVLRNSNPDTPVIIDFGAAKNMKEFLSQAIGSGMYMDPTIVEYGPWQPDPRWDLYSLAVLSYEAMFPVEFAELRSLVKRRENSYRQVRDKMRRQLMNSSDFFLQAIAAPLDTRVPPKQIVDWLALMVTPSGMVPPTTRDDSDEVGTSVISSSQPQRRRTQHTLGNKCREIERRFKLPRGSVGLVDRDENLQKEQLSLVSFLHKWERDSFELGDRDTVASARGIVEYVLGMPEGSVRIVNQEGGFYHGKTNVKTVRDEYGQS